MTSKRPRKHPSPKQSAAERVARGSRRWTWIGFSAMAIAGLATYANGLGGEFVFDDIASVQDNPNIRALFPLQRAMSLSLLEGSETVARRPLLSLSFALNYALLGGRPWGFRLVNVLIHIAAALLLFGIVRRTLRREPFQAHFQGRGDLLALLAALLWMVHPLQTESVTYIAQRAESLMGMLLLSTLYCSVRGFERGSAAGRGTNWWYVAAVVVCAAGMAVKEVMAAAPLVVVLYDRTFVAKSFAAAWRERRIFYSALAATWLILFVILMSGWEGASDDFTNPNRRPLDYARLQPGVVLHYLRLSVCPAPLVINYSPKVEFSVWYTMVSYLVIGGLLAGTLWGLLRGNWLGFMGSCFFLILAPSSSFAALMQKIAEHRIYLSLAVVVVLFALGVDWLQRRVFADRAERLGKFAGACVLLVVIVVFAVLSYARNYEYRTNIALWRSAIRHQPDNETAYNNLGVMLIRQGDYAAAVEVLRQAVELDPKYDEGHFNLGLAHFRRGETEDAIREFRRAIDINSGHWKAHHLLGEALVAADRPDEAAPHFQMALRINPRHAPAYYELGLILQDRGQLPAAVAAYQRALEFAPEYANAHFNLANALAGMRRLDQAIAHYRRSLELAPDDADAHCNLGTALLQQGMLSQAIDQYQQAINIDSHHLQSHYMLGTVYLEQGQREQAITHLEQALRIQPDFPQAQEALMRARDE